MTPFAAELLAWYRENARDLPWRRTQDPYHIWVSEIMLQQTQVDTVIPYYERFLTLFPTLTALALAPTEQVLKAWEGLGYYSRARNLQKGAQTVLEAHNGQVPADAAALRQLPGVGDYTTGAIASIAFGLPVPAVDGNVLRVVSRVAAYDGDIAKPAAKAEVTRWVAGQMPATDAGDFTQAMMELGATVCSPTRPACQSCPVAGRCEAKRQQLVDKLPVKSKKTPPRPETSVVGVIWDGERVLVQQRPDQGLLAGMWEFPTFAASADDAGEAVLVRQFAERGLTVAITSPLATIEHTFSHIKMTYQAFLGRRLDGETAGTTAHRWATLAEIDRLPFSKAQLRLLTALKERPLLAAL